MRKVLSITVPEDLYRRLLELESRRGKRGRSRIVQEALRAYLSREGPDPRVVRRWAARYAKVSAPESAGAGRWGSAQSGSLGAP